MKTRRLLNHICAMWLAAFATIYCAASVGAETLSYRRSAGEFSVYLAVMPGEVLSGPPTAADPGASPFQQPAGKDIHHVMVSIFDSRTGRRITNATVEARVAALGFSGMKKPLENTSVMGNPVYAGLFPMQGRGPFKVDIEFHSPENARREHATFYFSHPSFAPPKDREKNLRSR